MFTNCLYVDLMSFTADYYSSIVVFTLTRWFQLTGKRLCREQAILLLRASWVLRLAPTPRSLLSPALMNKETTSLSTWAVWWRPTFFLFSLFLSFTEGNLWVPRIKIFPFHFVFILYSVVLVLYVVIFLAVTVIATIAIRISKDFYKTK